MKSACLLLASCLAISLKAEEPVVGDPFSAYYQAIDGQISAVLDRERSQPSANREIASVEKTASSNAEDEVKTFPERFWGGPQPASPGALDRFERFRARLEAILKAEGVPKQLAAVVLVESGAQPFALSRRQARGLWQLIPNTARRYGQVVSDQRDERVQLELATQAAARYLRDLHRQFGDWPLALAAYNAGPDAVEAALKKGGASTFWQLKSAGLLPSETRGYVPSVLAAMHVIGPTAQKAPANPKPQRSQWIYALTTPPSIVNVKSAD